MSRVLYRRNGGFTLIELLVAMTIGLVVVIAAAAALTVSRIGFTTVDSASQLRDSTRFAADMIQRISVQTGFRDAFFAAASASTRPPDISGYNNAKINSTDPLNLSVARSSTEVGYGSDVLILRYQGVRIYPTDKPDGTQNTETDQSMIDCAGNAPAAVPDFSDATASSTRMVSIFHVALDQGEPSLMCTTQDPVTSVWTTSPIAQGVENFQVLFGVDGVTAGHAPTAGAAAPNVPSSYLRADELVVPGDAVGTAANWSRVRALRIGMVLRSAPGSAQDTSAKTFYPFGNTPRSSTATVGTAFSSTNDPGTAFAPTPDGRLRQVSTFTIHLRNSQGL